MLIATAAGVVSLRQRTRHAPHEERQQVKWLLLAALVLFAFGTFWGITELAGYPELATTAAWVFVPLVPLALGVAILRHRLYDIDVLLNRTLVYVTLSAILAVVYVATVVLFQWLLSAVTAESNAAIAASTLAVAALFRPLRSRIQRFIDRRFYRQKYDAAATVGRFSARLRDEVELDALGRELLAAVGETMHPATAHVWLRTPDS